MTKKRGSPRTTDQALTIKGKEPDVTIVVCVGTIRLTPAPHRDMPVPPYDYDLFIDKQSGHPYTHPVPLIKGDLFNYHGQRLAVQGANHDFDTLATSTPPSLTTDTDGLRHQKPGPFILKRV